MIRSIEGVRGVAAVMVALFHVYVYGRWGGLPAQSDVLRHAWLFVDLFFVVSGFVMAANYADRIESGRSALAYMVRRFFRLYPLHVVTTATVLFAVIAVQTVKLLAGMAGFPMGTEPPFAVKFFDPLLLLLDALLLQGIGIVREELHNYPSWSISVEFWMYVIFALLVLAVRARALRIAISALIVFACIVHFVTLWADVPADLQTLDTRGLGRGMLSFFQGVLVYYLWAVASGALQRIGEVALSAAQIAAAGFALSMIGAQPQLGGWQLAIPTAFAALVFVLLPDRGLIARGLQTWPMQWLGTYSYSIYLCHVTMETILDWPGRAVPEPWKHLVGLLYLAGVFGMSMLTYRYIEVPWRDRGKRIAARIERGESTIAPARIRVI